MIKSLKVISLIFICLSIFIIFYLFFINQRSVVVQNKIIDSVFNIDYGGDYLGYIEIPKFNIKRVIMEGTSSSVLDNLFVGLYEKSNDLSSDDLIILAGHNVPLVFSCLHDISIGDSVFLISGYINRRFDVYDLKVVRDNDFSFFNNRCNELLLITCTDTSGYRLLVFLKEVL